MILISHRGNISGPIKEKENSPNYIKNALSSGFDVEIDVWFIDNQFYLGHDEPTHKVEEKFLINSSFWCHAKNLDALTQMLKNKNIHCFWHQNDDVALTSNSFIWTFPGKEIASTRAIAVLPERIQGWNISCAYGVCSDYVRQYQ